MKKKTRPQSGVQRYLAAISKKSSKKSAKQTADEKKRPESTESPKRLRKDTYIETAYPTRLYPDKTYPSPSTYVSTRFYPAAKRDERAYAARPRAAYPLGRLYPDIRAYPDVLPKRSATLRPNSKRPKR